MWKKGVRRARARGKNNNYFFWQWDEAAAPVYLMTSTTGAHVSVTQNEADEE